jgi:hypothetical protein
VTISESACVIDERLDSGQIIVEPPDGLKNELVPRAKLSWASSGRSAVICSETAVQFAVIAFEQVVRELQPLESVHQSLCKRRRSLHEPGSKTLRRVDVASRAT